MNDVESWAEVTVPLRDAGRALRKGAMQEGD